MTPAHLSIGGAGGLYLLPQPGELIIRLHKRDLGSSRSATHLRAILVGPDRRRLDEATIEGDGDVQLSTEVETTGIYAVNVTIASDRYGDHVRWGFRTNCAKYLVETSRGHRDATHLEPILLDAPGTAQDVFFRARPGDIGIEVAELTPGVAAPVLFDEQDRRISELTVAEDGTAGASIPAGERSAAPWRLHVPGGVGTIHIDGVTRWQPRAPWDGLSLWSPTRDSFFSLHDLRWMLTPYHHAFIQAPGATHETRLRLHNNGTRTDTFRLAVQAADLEVKLSQNEVILEPGAATHVTAVLMAPGGSGTPAVTTARIRVTSANHPDVSTWSTLEARISDRSNSELPSFEVATPLEYRPYEHENAQYGYTPDYPNHNQIYNAPDGTDFSLSGHGVHRLDADGWQHQELIVDGVSYRTITSKVGFGADGAVCLLGRSSESIAYLYSADGGDTFTATPLPARGSRADYDIETFTGHNLPAGPAPFVRAAQTAGADPDNFWRRVNDLELFLPRLEAGHIVLGEPILVSPQAIGIAAHSGVPAALASQGDRVHVIWGEATDPDGDEPGVPTRVATWDRTLGRWLGEPALVGYGPPANDVHNTPSLTIDSQGYLHSLTGTHGSPFAYARSLAPNTAHDGFTEAELVEADLRSTYVGLVCDPQDMLHLVFRAWTADGVHHPVSYYANLGYKRKPKQGPWEPMQRLAVAPFSEYSIWYHRLTIDRQGRLLVSFDYWSTYWFYRTDHVGNHRKTIFSADGGDTWKLLRTKDLQ
jgi:hypothetical protein